MDFCKVRMLLHSSVNAAPDMSIAVYLLPGASIYIANSVPRNLTREQPT